MTEATISITVRVWQQMRASGVVICSLKVRGCLAASAGVVTRSVKVRVRWLQVRVCGNPVFKCACLAAGAGVVANPVFKGACLAAGAYVAASAGVAGNSVFEGACLASGAGVRNWGCKGACLAAGTGVGNSVCRYGCG